MSVEAQVAIEYCDAISTPQQMLVGLFIADNADHNKDAVFTVERIAHKARMSIGQVEKSIKELEDIGIISIRSWNGRAICRVGGNGGG